MLMAVNRYLAAVFAVILAIAQPSICHERVGGSLRYRHRLGHVGRVAHRLREGQAKASPHAKHNPTVAKKAWLIGL
jgi:hypothetical protein